MLALLAPALLLSGTDAPLHDDLGARVARAPKQVAAFVRRRADCNHFLGEEPYDRERAAELNRVVRELRCGRVERDERRLREAYRHDAAVLRLLDETADLPGF